MWSTSLHALSSIALVFATLAIALAWLTGNDLVPEFDKLTLIENAKVLYLASIAFGVMTAIHMKEESESKSVRKLVKKRKK